MHESNGRLYAGVLSQPVRVNLYIEATILGNVNEYADDLWISPKTDGTMGEVCMLCVECRVVCRLMYIHYDPL